MRVEVGTYEALRVKEVRFNGETFKFAATVADEEQGYIEYCAENDDGSLKVINGALVIERITGKVEIIMEPDNA